MVRAGPEYIEIPVPPSGAALLVPVVVGEAVKPVPLAVKGESPLDVTVAPNVAPVAVMFVTVGKTTVGGTGQVANVAVPNKLGI